MPANLENSAVDWKRSVFTPIPKKGNAKECTDYHVIVLISHASKVILKILQTRLQQYVNQELPDIQTAFRKGRGTRDLIPDHLRRRKWQPTPVFLPGESQGRGSLLACRLWGRTESDTTDVT